MRTDQPELNQYMKEICEKAAELGLDEHELNDIANSPVKIYSYKATIEANKIWDERGLTNEVMDKWLNDQF